VSFERQSGGERLQFAIECVFAHDVGLDPPPLFDEQRERRKSMA
jgi:hypothetical protein